MMMKGKMIYKKKQVGLNVPVIYHSVATFTAKLLSDSDSGKNLPFKLQLESFVDGVKPVEPIFTGYIVTFKLTINKNEAYKEPASQTIAPLFNAYLVEDQVYIEQVFRPLVHGGAQQFPKVQSIAKQMTEGGNYKYQIVFVSNLGQVILSNQAKVNVLQLPEEDDHMIDEDDGLNIRGNPYEKDEDNDEADGE
jgi:hypothetical protein